MIRKVLTRVAVTGFALLLACGFVAPAAASWSLVWSDEFNGTSLNTADWNYDTGTGCPSLCGWGNNELQYYQAQNVAVSGGNLIITTKEESVGNSQYTSGKVHTRNKRSFLYGRMEMRAKIPTGGGMWPAFWMMPQDDAYGGWAASGEIDIMESANATTSIGGALHYGGAWPSNTYTNGSYSLGGASFADDFHIYAVEWEPDAIRWYVDDVLYMTRTSAQWYTNAAPGNPRAPFDQPFYIILNAAIGGNYTGCNDPGCITASLPQQYVIDYVRVYEDIPNELPTVTITSPAQGATLPTGDITITATASDTDGSVAQVEFYDGATLLGSDATSPYSFTWTGVGDGCYDIVARVIDDLGGTDTDAVNVSVGTGCGQAPYLGSPFVLPTRIQVEDYDEGGPGIAYNDQDPVNNGGQYRASEAVDIEACTDAGGGYNIGWLNAGEWLEYTIEVPTGGAFTLEARVASQSTGGAFQLSANGTDLAGTILFPATGGWQSWTTVTATVNLDPGIQTLRFTAGSSGFNVNYLDLLGNNATGLPGPGSSAGYVLHASQPNPFRSNTLISYELPRPETVHLNVYDVSGRLVRGLMQGDERPAGPQQVAWDGRDDDGRPVSPGVYFYRLEAGAFSDTRRVTLVR